MALDNWGRLEELLKRVAVGDRDAFSELYDRTSSLVYGLALRVLRSPAHAEEATQEVYLQIWTTAASFDSDRGSAISWLTTLAHRRAVDTVRRTQSARDREASVPTDVPGADVAEWAVTADEHRRVLRALAGLTELQRQVIDLAYFGGLTYREVAESLGAPLGTIKTRMRDALARMRSILEGDDG